VLGACVTFSKVSDSRYPTYAILDQRGLGVYDDPKTNDELRFFFIRASMSYFKDIMQKVDPGMYSAIIARVKRLQGLEPGEKTNKDVYISSGEVVRNACGYNVPFPRPLSSCHFVPEEKQDENGNRYWELPKTFTQKRFPNLAPKLKHVATMKDTSNKGDGEILEGKPYPEPVCLATFAVKLSTCSSCCCQEGLIKMAISSSELVKNRPDCGLWFSVMDFIFRLVASFFRTSAFLMQMKTCLAPPCKGKINLETGHCETPGGK